MERIFQVGPVQLQPPFVFSSVGARGVRGWASWLNREFTQNLGRHYCTRSVRAFPLRSRLFEGSPKDPRGLSVRSSNVKWTTTRTGHAGPLRQEPGSDEQRRGGDDRQCYAPQGEGWVGAGAAAQGGHGHCRDTWTLGRGGNRDETYDVLRNLHVTSWRRAEPSGTRLQKTSIPKKKKNTTILCVLCFEW